MKHGVETAHFQVIVLSTFYGDAFYLVMIADILHIICRNRHHVTKGIEGN